jgi:hypothetical protein
VLISATLIIGIALRSCSFLLGLVSGSGSRLAFLLLFLTALVLSFVLGLLPDSLSLLFVFFVEFDDGLANDVVVILIEFSYHSLSSCWPLAQRDADFKHQVLKGGEYHRVGLVELQEEAGELGNTSSFDDGGGVPGELREHLEHFEHSKLV